MVLKDLQFRAKLSKMQILAKDPSELYVIVLKLVAAVRTV